MIPRNRSEERERERELPGVLLGQVQAGLGDTADDGEESFYIHHKFLGKGKQLQV